MFESKLELNGDNIDTLDTLLNNFKTQYFLKNQTDGVLLG